jgi:hypothetical protein
LNRQAREERKESVLVNSTLHELDNRVT